jgi:hypothetical protein
VRIGTGIVERMSERSRSHYRRAYDARPGRAAVVVADLLELHGPTSGLVTLPNRLFWQTGHAFDLSDEASLTWMYETVLREAARTDEIRTWLDGPTLVRLWPALFLPGGVRAAWELRHPSLRAGAPSLAA